MHLQECGEEEKEKNTRVLARLAGPGEAKGAGTRLAREWFVEIWPNPCLYVAFFCRLF
jgi:hypothetical protein